mgnify:CR=1 FL=1
MGIVDILFGKKPKQLESDILNSVLEQKKIEEELIGYLDFSDRVVLLNYKKICEILDEELKSLFRLSENFNKLYLDALHSKIPFWSNIRSKKGNILIQIHTIKKKLKVYYDAVSLERITYVNQRTPNKSFRSKQKESKKILNAEILSLMEQLGIADGVETPSETGKNA